MIAATLACLGLSLAGPAGPEATATSAADRAAYLAARAAAGRDADAHVRLALWCEARGLEAERVEHLGIAILADPAHALARGLLGLTRQEGRWVRPVAVRDRIREDSGLAAKLAEYNSRREATPDTAKGHWDLAVWCDEQGLEPEAEAHFTAVTRLAPGRAEAWKRLGYVRSGGRWVTPEGLAAERAEGKAQAEATARWVPRLEAIKRRLGDRDRRDEALRELEGIGDPRAIPAIGRVFAAGSPEMQKVAVQLLGQIDTPAAAGPLVMLAVGANDAEVRRAAGETLVRRDRRESLGLLTSLVRTPVRYEVVENQGVGGHKSIRVEGEAAVLQREYAAPAPPPSRDFADLMRMQQQWAQEAAWREALRPKLNPDVAAAFRAAAANPGDPAASLNAAVANGPSAAGLAFERNIQLNFADDVNFASTLSRQQQAALERIGRNRSRYEQSVAEAETQFQSDLAALEASNCAARQANGRILPLLSVMTGQDLGEDRPAWSKWWTEQQGYSYRPPKKVTYLQVATGPSPSYEASNSCFARGTPVQTIDGPRPIETLRIGDRVLSQDAKTGTLAYQPVLAVFHNEPNETRRLYFEGVDEAIVATPIHRFWKLGRGWTMARDLKPGDAVRLLGGTARVASVLPGPVQPVFNLEVARTHSFLVGARGVLVHDNSLIEPVGEPFDAPAKADLAAASGDETP
jgi:hypothetical protein